MIDEKQIKKINKMMKLNYTVNTDGVKKIIKVQVIIAAMIVLWMMSGNMRSYSNLLDIIVRFIGGTISFYVVVAILTTFFALIFTGSVRGISTNARVMSKFASENQYGEYCLDYLTYLLNQGRISREEYDAYIESDRSLSYMLKEMNYKPKKVWFEK